MAESEYFYVLEYYVASNVLNYEEHAAEIQENRTGNLRFAIYTIWRTRCWRNNKKLLLVVI